MIAELGLLHICDDDDVALTRNKAYQLGLALGVSAVRSSRMAAQLSDYCRGIQDGDIQVQLIEQPHQVSLSWTQADWNLQETITHWPEQHIITDQQQYLQRQSRPAMQRQVAERTRQLKQRARELEESTRLKSEFLANMSHELRTPMNSIIGFTGRVLKKAGDELSARHVKNLKTVERNAHHLLGLINSLLDLSKIEAGKMDIFAEDFCVDALFTEVMELTDSLVTNKGISIDQDSPQEPIEIYTDKTKLKQILINLISNAVKFTDEGGVTLHARLAENNAVQIKVIDTGLGMEADALSYIFEAFRQVDGSNTRTHGGTGLGLNITSRFCDMLGGEVQVESEVGVGSTFIVTLPLKYQAKTAKDVIELDIQAMETDTAAEPLVIEDTDNSASGPVVLCIDDNLEVLELLSEYLSDAGYHAVCVSNGQDGLLKARELQPIAITLDVQMPHKDGWSVLKELKDDPVTRDIPVLMATMMENKALGFELGAYDYLQKPIMPDNLIQSIEGLPTRVQHVLVVDDNEGVRDLMQQTLDDQGITSSLAVDGVDAIKQLEDMGDELPDMIILDLMMPRMNGFEVLDKLNEHDLWKHIPVLVSTAKTLSQNEKNLLASKAKYVVQKGGDGLNQLSSLIRNDRR